MKTPRNLWLTAMLAVLTPLLPGFLFAENRPPEIAARGGGRALQFDGTNDYVANTNAAFGIRSNLTVTAWFRNTDDFLKAEYNTYPMGNYLLSKGVSAISGGPYNDYFLTLSPDRRVSFTIVREDQTQFWVTSLPLPNTPHHLAGVCDFDQSRLRLYVDGQLAGETTATGRLRNYSNDLFIGDWNGSSSWHFHHGEMDEVRIWNVACSEADIRREMRFQLATNEPGLVAYWAFDEASGTTAVDQAPGGSNGTLVNGPLRLASPVPRFAPVLATNSGPAQITVTLQGSDPDNDPITAYLTQLPAFGSLFQTADGVSLGAAITTVPAAVTSPSRHVIYRRLPGYTGIDDLQYLVSDGQTNSETATVSLDVVAPSGEAQCTPVPPGIVAWWKGEGTATDSAGTNNGTLTNEATYALGVVGQAFSFDGTNGYASVPDSASLDLTGPLAIEGWILLNKVNETSYSKVILWKGIQGATTKTSPYALAVGTNNALSFSIGNGSSYNEVEGKTALTTNIWYHVAGVADGLQMWLYLNGVEEAVTNQTIVPYNSSYSLRIGNSGWDTPVLNHFSGRVDELGLYNRALSSNEVATIYAAGAAGMCFGPPVITQQPASTNVAAGDPATFAVTAAGALPLAYQWQFNTTNLPNATNASFSLQPSALSDSGGYRVIVSNSAGAVTSQVATLIVTNPFCAPPPAGLVAWWKAEGNANDLVGGNNGYLSNGVSFAMGRVGTAFNLNGTNGQIVIPDGPSLSVTGAITVEAWINPTTVSTQPIIASQYDSHAGQAAWALAVLSSDGRLRFGVYGPTAFREADTANPVIVPGRFSHVVGSFDPSTQDVKIYVNGVVVPVVLYPGSGTVPFLRDSTAPIRLGAFVPASGNVGSFFGGLMDEVSIYNRALTSNEIAAIYAAGSAGKCQQCGDWYSRLVALGGAQWPTAAGGNGHYYFPTDSATDWWSAERAAQAYGGHLIAINDAAEQSFVEATFLVGAALYRPIWIGLSDEVREGIFAWTTGEPVSYAKWKSGEPNNSGGNEDYVALNWERGRGGALGTWNDCPVGGTGDYGAGTIGPYFGLVELATPPPCFVVLQDLTNQTVPVGQPVVFGFGVAGPQPMQFQWWFNGAPISGQTNASLSLGDAQGSHAGAYSATVTSLWGSVTSQVAVLTVITNIPDLRVSLLTSAATALGGELLTVSWVATNAGNATAGAPWDESLYLVAAEVTRLTNWAEVQGLLTSAATKASWTFTNTLAAGEAAARTRQLIVPGGLSGSYSLVALVDSSNQVAEGYGETNNWAVTPLVIASPDLSVSLLTSAATARFGEPFAVEWAVANAGPGPAGGTWSDRVWRSAASNSLVGATLLATVPANGGSLATNASYTNNATVTVPLEAQSVEGGCWLVVEADANGSVAEMDEANNLRSVPLTLQMPPLPDLVAAFGRAPLTASPGEAVELVWAVTNLGPASVNNAVWREAVYLVGDEVTSLTNVQSLLTSAATLGTFTFTNTLAAGGWLVRTQSVTVPVDSETGNLRYVVAVDAANGVVEGNETNNFAVATNVTLVPAVLTLSAPGSLAEGASALAMVTRNGSRAAALTVTVVNSNTNELSFHPSLLTSAPTNVVIPAGAASASFLIRGVGGDGVDGPKTWRFPPRRRISLARRRASRCWMWTFPSSRWRCRARCWRARRTWRR